MIQNKFGVVVLMGTHLVCNQKLRVRFSPAPPSFALVSLMVEVRSCKASDAVRFRTGAPIVMVV